MAYTSNYTGEQIDARLAKTDDIIDSVNGVIAETDSDGNMNIQLYVTVPEAVMELADSGSTTAQCVAAFGDVEDVSNWVVEVEGGKQVQIKVGNTTIPSTNVTFVRSEDDEDVVYIGIDYSTDEARRSLKININGDLELDANSTMTIEHETTTRKQVINIPYAVMALATSASGSDIVTAFGGESAMTNIIKAIQNGAMAQLELVSGDMTIYIPFNVLTYEVNSDDILNLSATFLEQTTVISILIDDTLTDSAVLSAETTSSSGYTSWVRGSLYLATTSTVDSALNYYLGGDDNIVKLIGCIDNLGTVMLNNAMENDVYLSPIEYVTYNWSDTNRVVGFKIPLESANTIKEIVVDMTDTSALSVTSVTSSVLDSSVQTTSTIISNLNTITNQNGMFSTTSTTTGTFPTDIDTDAKKKGSLVRVSNSEATDTEGFDIWMSTDTSMSNYVYYRRYSGTGTVTSWFRLLDTETPDVMHANTTPLTTTSTHLKSGTYAIDDDTTIEGVSAGYGSMLVQMENYSNNTGIRTLTMITGDDAGKTFVSTVITGTYGAFNAMVTLAQYNALEARVTALENAE